MSFLFRAERGWNLLDGGADLVVGGVLLEPDGQIDDGHVGGGDTESHAGELAVELRNDLSRKKIILGNNLCIV